MITDRTIQDIQIVKALHQKPISEWTEEDNDTYWVDLKGAFNRSDYKRIQDTIRLISDVLELGLETFTTPTIITRRELDETLMNIEFIRRNSPILYKDTPKTPDYPLNTYEKLNDVEKILDDVYTLLFNNFYDYTGEVIAGAETLL